MLNHWSASLHHFTSSKPRRRPYFPPFPFTSSTHSLLFLSLLLPHSIIVTRTYVHTCIHKHTRTHALEIVSNADPQWTNIVKTHFAVGTSEIEEGKNNLSCVSQVFTRYGKCYTFNAGDNGRPPLITTKGGMGNGLELMLDIQQDEYLPVWGETGQPAIACSQTWLSISVNISEHETFQDSSLKHTVCVCSLVL